MSEAIAEGHDGLHPTLLGKVGMACLIAVESSFLATFAVIYLYYVGKSINGPYPEDVLEVPVFASVVLLSSSASIHLAIATLRRAKYVAFLFWWGITMAAGATFLAMTLHEWDVLMFEHHLRMSSNVFGSTFYTLVGAHAAHVLVGLVLLAVVFVLGLMRRLRPSHAGRVDLIGWYWHFVDAVWVVVFTIVYVVGK
jgi:cytochrome c oxidase subunit 3/cytochrome o ubiquinol oxidase subunit 3